MLMMLFATLLTDFMDLVGHGVLCFREFLWEFEEKKEDANFEKLFVASKTMSMIAKCYNMQISPYSSSLGMTLSFLENKYATRKEFEDLIAWIEVPTDIENFERFRYLVQKYNDVAENSAKEGIAEKHHWTFERFIALFGNIVIPLAIAVIVVVLPKLLEMFWKFSTASG